MEQDRLPRELRDFVCYIAQVMLSHYEHVGPGSSVGIATDYVLNGGGSNPGGNEVFRPSRPVLGSTQPPVQWLPGLSRG